MKKRRKKLSYTEQYAALYAVLAVFLAAVIAVAVFASRSGGSSPSVNGTADTLDGAEYPPAMNEIGYGDAYSAASSAELASLVGSGALDAYYDKHSAPPTVIVEDGAVFDSNVSINCGVKLIFAGSASVADGTRISIVTKDECEISLFTDLGADAFFIDAPNASLLWSGGNVPFSYEIARYMNVGSFNGSVPTDGGDALGGKGDATVTGITLYTGKDKKHTADAEITVDGNIITVAYPYDFDASDIENAYIDITTDGSPTLDTAEPIDLSSPSLISVKDENGQTRTYRLTAKRRSYGIPILELDTDGVKITSKESYVTAVMTLDGESYSLGIRGRGNASWNTFPKKAYRIKLDEKAKLLGMSANRDWVLVSNYADPSLIRNQLASDIAKELSGLDFTPTHVSVDLYINGEYLGVYCFAEKIEDAKNRVDLGDPVTDENGNVTDFGFLLEVGWDYSSENVFGKDLFDLSYIKRIYMKEPKVEKKGDDTYKYIYAYMKAAEKAVTSGEGWQDYLDAHSWVDWFIVNELCNNTESAFYRSFFMYKTADGKLAAGPIWDYDMAFGNFTGDLPEYDTGWVTVDSTYHYITKNWMHYLLQNDEFVSLVKARWAEVGETLYKTALASLDANSAAIKTAAQNNFERWDEILGKKVGLSRASRLYDTWDGQIEYIRGFLKTRYNFMNERLSRDGGIL